MEIILLIYKELVRQKQTQLHISSIEYNLPLFAKHIMLNYQQVLQLKIMQLKPIAFLLINKYLLDQSLIDYQHFNKHTFQQKC